MQPITINQKHFYESEEEVDSIRHFRSGSDSATTPRHQTRGLQGRRVASLELNSFTYQVFSLKNYIKSQLTLPALRTDGKIVRICINNAGDRLVLRSQLKDFYFNLDVLKFNEINRELTRIKKALNYQIFEFVDDKGAIIYLENVFKKILERYEDSLLPNEKGMLDEILDRIRIRHKKEICEITKEEVLALKEPKSWNGFSANQKKCLNMFLRIYLEETDSPGVISPQTILGSYRLFVTTEELFQLAAHCVSDADFPLIQKMRVLYLCNSWFKKFPHIPLSHDLLIKVQHVITAGLESQNNVLIDLSFDISFLLYEKAKISPLGEMMEESFPLWTSPKILAEDMLRLSYLTHLKVSSHELLFDLIKEEKKEAPFLLECTNHFNRLVEFVRTSLSEEKNGREIYQSIISIADTLFQAGDFPSVAAIVTALSSQEIEKQYLATDWITLEVLVKDKKISSKSIKKWKEIFPYFNPASNYENLRKECQSRIQGGLPVIPYVGIYTWYIDKIKQGNRDLSDDGTLNFEKLNILSKQVWHFQKALNHSMEHFLKLNNPLQLSTPLMTHLEKKRV